MNDYDKLKKCFDEIGIEYRENKGIAKFIQIESHSKKDFINIVFDDNGKYIEMQ